MADWSVTVTTSTPGPLTGGAPVAFQVVATNTTADLSPVTFDAKISLGIVGAAWSAAPSGGAVWTPNASAPVPIAGELKGPLGASVTFTVTGTLDPRFANEELEMKASCGTHTRTAVAAVTKWWTPTDWGLIPSNSACQIGCEPGQAYIGRRGGVGRRAIRFREDAKIVRGRNKPAEFTGLIPWECCDSDTAQITHWAFEIEVQRPDIGQRGGTSFVGPVISARHSTAGIEVVARGMSAWWTKRAMTTPLGASSMTGGDAIQALHAQAMAPDSSPNFTVDVVGGPTGLSTSDDLFPSDGWYIADAVGKVDYNVSWFDFGRRVIVTPRYTGPPLRIDQEHFLGELGLVLDGSETATVYKLYGAPGSGVYSEAHADPAIVAYYGVLQYVTRSDTITQQSTADRTAITRLENKLPSEKLAAPDNIELAPRTPICRDELWPGRLVLISGEVGCRELNRIMRLDTVEEWLNGTVKVSMSTIPLTQQAEVIG